MRWDREQRLGQLADIFHEEVLDILTRQYNGRLLFADALHKVADVLDRREIGKEEVELVNTRDRISAAQKLFGHICEDIEQQSIADILARLEQPLNAECNEIIIRYIRIPIEELTLRPLAYRVQSEADIL